MYYLTAVPCEPYFLWQLQVQHDNFRRMGVDPADVYCLIGYRGQVPADWQAYAASAPEHLLFYPDERQNPQYSPSIRPHVCARFFAEHPEKIEDWCFYHDADIWLTRPINWEALTGDHQWKVSETRSYVGYEYIRETGTDVLLDMCEIVGIPPMVVRANQAVSGGAQYLIHHTSGAFWQKVERDCERLYSRIREREAEYAAVWSNLTGKPKKDYKPLQIWCADMWALLWNGWKAGFETSIDPGLAFSWGTSPIDDFVRYPIFHNAGVTHELQQGKFYKSQYTHRSPYGDDFLTIPADTCSWVYAQGIRRTDRRLNSQPVNRTHEQPLVSCVMATKGRFEKVQRSIACFLAQTYPNKELIIFNNDTVPLTLDPQLTAQGVRLINQHRSGADGQPYRGLQAIWEDSISYAKGEIYIEWDDDDIFLPHHIATGVAALKASGQDAWMPRRSLMSTDSGQTFEWISNYIEPSVVLWRDAAERHGFHYVDPQKVVAWRLGVEAEGQLAKTEAATFCYVWGDGISHFSAGLQNPDNFEQHRTVNQQVGGMLTADYAARDRWYAGIDLYLSLQF